MKKPLLLLSAGVLLLTSCATLENLAMKQVARMFSGSGGDSGAMTAFLEDDDPEYVGESLPSLMKVLEILVQKSPKEPGIHFTTGMICIMYANAYIQGPASMLSMDDYELQSRENLRAKRMYQRGRDYILKGLDIKYPGFRDQILTDQFDLAFSRLVPEDAQTLYWCGAGWVAMFSCDPFDFEVSATSYRGTALLLKAMQINDGLNSGAVHDVLIQLYTAMPALIISAIIKSPELSAYYTDYYQERMVSDDPRERAIYHYRMAIFYSDGKMPGPYVSYATAFSIADQDPETFTNMLKTALSINADENKANRLMILLSQKKAAWLLDHIEDYFILDQGE
jgi:predicted anti-sigma-YlaC factor YlaD